MSSRVLLVSKNPLALIGISQALRLHLQDVTVETASTGCDALILVATHAFDAIIFPSSLPDLHGLDLLRQVKAIRSDSAVFFVGDAEDFGVRAEALRQGAFAFIEQPLIIEHFIPQLRVALHSTTQDRTSAIGVRQPA